MNIFINNQNDIFKSIFNFKDSTSDYINGNEVLDIETGLHLSGLRCVTVLIGAYSQSSRLPIIGVVNQPFYTENKSQ